MKKCIVTGAAGFAGANLVELLLKEDYFVYAVVRPNSPHNCRLQASPNLQLIQQDMIEYGKLDEIISDSCDYVFHLAWQGDRYNFTEQYSNVAITLDLLKAVQRTRNFRQKTTNLSKMKRSAMRGATIYRLPKTI